MAAHREFDALISSYTHLRNLPRQDEALYTLKKIASLVKPIMRARGWRVSELAEFYPDQKNLLGLNVNRGQKILLRLRHPGDKAQFLPFEVVTDTMLHELCHIVHGPHDSTFQRLWDQLRDEHEGLLMKGCTGEGFISKGYRLGGSSRVPLHEARRLARAAAEQRSQRSTQSRGSGQRLGGAPIQREQDVRRVIADAVERRNQTNRGCGSTRFTEKEIRSISETATKNGFRTQAEEDAANEAAISQALWELVQEDERRKRGGKMNVPSSADFPGSNAGRALVPLSAVGLRANSPPPVPEWSRPSIPDSGKRTSPCHPTSDPGVPSNNSGWTCSTCTLHNRPSWRSCNACGSERPKETASGPLAQVSTDEWACKTCTLLNSPSLLSCDVCGSDRPRIVRGRPGEERATKMSRKNTVSAETRSRPNRPMSSADLAHARMVSFRNSTSGARSQSAHVPSGPDFWQCSRCGHVVERLWWSCAKCGNVKESSK